MNSKNRLSTRKKILLDFCTIISEMKITKIHRQQNVTEKNQAQATAQDQNTLGQNLKAIIVKSNL